MEKLLQLLRAVALMSPELQEHLKTIIRPKLFKKGTYIQRAGSICTHIWFIEKGLIRIYHEGAIKEMVTWLLKEGDIFIAVDSFFSQKPSSEYIQALEDTLVWGISYEELLAACLKYIEFTIHRDLIKTKYYELYNEIQKMVSLPLKDRYLTLMQVDPDLIHRVNLNDLASYLKMSLAKLSHIRRDISNGK
jgi:CRP-like cAMP-binding protein